MTQDNIAKIKAALSEFEDDINRNIALHNDITVNETTIAQLTRALRLAVDEIESIASYPEGETVDNGFDCPWHANTARKALTEIAGILEGKE